MNQPTEMTVDQAGKLRQATPSTGAKRKTQRAILLGMVAALALAPIFVYPVFLMKVLCFGIFAISFNLLIGFGGLLSFGHAAFFGLGSYACAYLAKEAGFGPATALACAVAICIVVGAVFGWIAVRRDGIYFAMITLALAQLVYFLAVQNPQFTGGENGIQAVPRGRLFGLFDLGNDLMLYGFVAVLFVACTAFVIRVVQSPFGQVCAAIRDNESRAVSLGYRVRHYKILLFTGSAALAGVAGGAKALVFQMATLTDVHWTTSGEVILMTLLGGLGTLFGPVVGALLVVTLQNFLSGLGEWVSVIQGVIFAVCVLSFRAGIVGVISRLWTARAARRAAAESKG